MACEGNRMMKSVLDYKQKEWAYDMWCLGYTQRQIADALFVSEKTICRILNGKQRVRPILKYTKEECNNGK